VCCYSSNKETNSFRIVGKSNVVADFKTKTIMSHNGSGDNGTNNENKSTSAVADGFAQPAPFKRPSKVTATDQAIVGDSSKQQYGLIVNNSDKDSGVANEQQVHSSTTSNSSTTSTSTSTSTVSLQKPSGAPDTPFNYTEPVWAGKPPYPYALEVLKDGTIIDTVDISRKSLFVIGRLPLCDIPLEHPVRTKKER
jgi:hypothetical protein